jgi:CRISPR/Cas system-associated protein Cas7 (RAMP superfamily)
MYLHEAGWVDMDWIDLAEDRDRWQAVVKAVMSLWVTYNVGNFLTRLVSQEGPCFMQ